MDDLYSKNYDVNEIEEDPRFIAARKEALFTHIFLLSMTLLFFAVIYITCPDSSSVTLIGGWPSWLVYSGMVVVVEFAVCIYFCTRYFTTCSLDATAHENREEGDAI